MLTNKLGPVSPLLIWSSVAAIWKTTDLPSVGSDQVQHLSQSETNAYGICYSVHASLRHKLDQKLSRKDRSEAEVALMHTRIVGWLFVHGPRTTSALAEMSNAVKSCHDMGDIDKNIPALGEFYLDHFLTKNLPYCFSPSLRLSTRSPYLLFIILTSAAFIQIKSRG